MWGPVHESGSHECRQALRGKWFVYLDKKREILTSKPANPPVQETFNIIRLVIEFKNFLDNLRNRPVLLEPVSLDSYTIALRNLVFPDSTHLSGHMVYALVVVHEPRRFLLECCVAFGILA
jgi:hypothetical protein